MPFEKPVFPIWALKGPLWAIHIQSGLTFTGRTGQAVDIKVIRIPRITIILQVSESTYDSFESRLVPSENLDLIFDGFTEIETWEKRELLIPQFDPICRRRGLNLCEPRRVGVQMNGSAGMRQIERSGLETVAIDPVLFNVDRSNVPLFTRPQTDREPIHCKGYKQTLYILTSTLVFNIAAFKLIQEDTIRIVAPSVHKGFDSQASFAVSRSGFC
jgi:hypothetical protein